MGNDKTIKEDCASDYKAVLKSPIVEVKFRNKKTKEFEGDKLYDVIEGL